MNAPISNDLIASPITWRKTTGLHRALGARVLKIPLNLVANTDTIVARFLFGPGTIDRVIAARIDLTPLQTPGQWVYLWDAISGWSKLFVNANDFYFPVETLIDGIDLHAYSTQTFAGNLTGPTTISNPVGIVLHLYNFEMPVAAI